jgi:hypothetical protein
MIKRSNIKRKNLIWIAPLAIVGMAVFAWIGGELVLHLWNWLAPALFGFREVTFWQALGLLALCRILFGGFGLSGGASNRSRGRMRDRWEQMTPAERERFRQEFHDRSGGTSPLDSEPSL